MLIDKAGWPFIGGAFVLAVIVGLLALCAVTWPGWLHPQAGNPAYARRVEWAVAPDPAMARAAGVRPRLVRTVATAIGGGFAGLAGATLVLAQVGTFAERMTAGRGYSRPWGPHPTASSTAG